MDRRKIRFREVAIVACAFLDTHQNRRSRRHVETSRFLLNLAAGHQNAGLALGFVFQTFFDVLKRIKVLHFRLRAEFVGSDRTNRNVDVGTHGAFFHLNVGNAGKLNDLAQTRQICIGFVNDFNQRRALTVQIDI